MATSTLTRTSPASKPAQVDIDEVEHASADLCVADTLLVASEKFIDSVRGWSAPRGAQRAAGIMPNEHVFEEVCRALTIIDEARDRVAIAKRRINGFVDEHFAARRVPEEAPPTTQAWVRALADYQQKRAYSDGLPDDAPNVDDAVEAYASAQDHLITKVPAPNLDALMLKLSMALERCADFVEMFPEHQAAIFEDIRRLGKATR